jgi:hypothetical protein
MVFVDLLHKCGCFIMVVCVGSKVGYISAMFGE